MRSCLIQDYLLIRNEPTLGPYSRPLPRVLWWFLEGGLFLMSEAPLYHPEIWVNFSLEPTVFSSFSLLLSSLELSDAKVYEP